MYVKNQTYRDIHECEKCKNISICKWCNEMKDIRNYVDNIPISKGLTPIKIEIVCSSFEKKIEKQDGWCPTNRDLY